MRNVKTHWFALARLELIQVLRSRAVLATLLVVTGIGVAAVVSGVQRVQDERATLADREAFLEEQRHYLTKQHAKDLGLLLYYLALPTEHAPNPWTALAVGMRDVYPYSQHLRVLGLATQLHAGELGSPLQQLTGHLDYAFVVTFLWPLLLIALCYDSKSRDDELGTDSLLHAQPMRSSRIVSFRLLLRASLVFALAHGLFVFAMVVAKLPLDVRAFYWTLMVTAYLAYWTAIVWIVVSRGRASSWNAITLVGIWIGLCIMLPAAANVMLLRPPTQSAIAFSLKQREILSAGWERPKQSAVEAFATAHADWRNVEVPEDRFSWTWYYANQELADRAVQRDLRQYREELVQRDAFTHGLAMVLPPLAMQRALSHWAGTDLSTRFAYQDSLARYHQQVKDLVYPWLVADLKATDVSLKDMPRHHFRPEPVLPNLVELFALLFTAAACLLLGAHLVRRLEHVT